MVINRANVSYVVTFCSSSVCLSKLLIALASSGSISLHTQNCIHMSIYNCFTLLFVPSLLQLSQFSVLFLHFAVLTSKQIIYTHVYIMVSKVLGDLEHVKRPTAERWF